MNEIELMQKIGDEVCEDCVNCPQDAKTCPRIDRGIEHLKQYLIEMCEEDEDETPQCQR